MEIKKVTEDMRKKLNAPLPAEAVKPHPTKTYLSSIKAIYVTERLNDVFGIGAWTLKTELITSTEKGMIVVKVTLTIPEYGVYYESFGGNDNGGEASKNFDLGDAYKGATTDAITKICSYMEIGIAVFKGQKSQPEPSQKPKSNNDSFTPLMSESQRKEIEALLAHPLMPSDVIEKGNEWLKKFDNSEASASVVIEAYKNKIENEKLKK